MIFLYVAVGGVAGALARFGVGLWAPFPWATLAINLTGSFLLGFFLRALPAWGAGVDVRALLTIGFCGSFTTFSTFGYEAIVLLQGGAYGAAALYAFGSVVLGIAGVAAGLALGSMIA